MVFVYLAVAVSLFALSIWWQRRRRTFLAFVSTGLYLAVWLDQIHYFTRGPAPRWSASLVIQLVLVVVLLVYGYWVTTEPSEKGSERRKAARK